MASGDKYVFEWILIKPRGKKEFILCPAKKTKKKIQRRSNEKV